MKCHDLIYIHLKKNQQYLTPGHGTLQDFLSSPEHGFPPLIGFTLIRRSFFPMPIDGDSPSFLQSTFWHSLQSSHKQSTNFYKTHNGKWWLSLNTYYLSYIKTSSIMVSSYSYLDMVLWSISQLWYFYRRILFLHALLVVQLILMKFSCLHRK